MAAMVSLSCVFCFGTTVGWNLSAEGLFEDENEYGFIISRDEWIVVTACLPVAAVICSLPVGMLVAHYGCKFVMYLQTLPYLLSWLILINMTNVYLLYIARFLQGMCGAAVCVTIPIYTLEISEIHHLFFGALFYGSHLTYFVTARYDLRTSSKVNLVLVLTICSCGLYRNLPHTMCFTTK